VPIGAAAWSYAVFQQEKRHVIMAMTASVPVHACYQYVQCLVAVSCEKRCRDLLFREEVSAHSG
jgi:hypothetical protein